MVDGAPSFISIPPLASHIKNEWMTDKHQFNMQQWKLGIVYRDELVFRSDGSMFYWTSGFPLQAINVQIIDMLSVRSKVYDWMWCMRHQGTHIDCYIQSDVSFIRRGQLNFHNFVERSLHPTSCLWMFFFSLSNFQPRQHLI